MTTAAQQETVDCLAFSAKRCLAPLPPGCEDMEPLTERLDLFAFSMFVELEGAGGMPQMRLSPKSHPEVNLVDHGMHSTWPRVDLSNNTYVRTFMTAVAGVLAEAKELDVDRREAMGHLATAVCRVIEDGYDLRAEHYYEDDDDVELSADVAPGLADAFRAAWTPAETDAL